MSDQTYYDSLSAAWSDSLRQRLPGDSVQYFKSIGSTNDVLLGLSRHNPDKPITFRLAVADHQTAGRGRRGDAWLASAGKNLLFSVLLPLDLEKRYWTRIPQLIAWTMGRAIESVIDPGLRIEAKWPNDLYLTGKKLGGILVETSLTPEPFAVVGVGLNVNSKQGEFPPEIRDIATSLYEHLGCESNRWYLLEQFLENLLDGYPENVIDFDECLSWIRERDYLRDREVLIKQPGDQIPVKGLGHGIGNEGELLVKMGSGKIEEIYSAESLIVGKTNLR